MCMLRPCTCDQLKFTAALYMYFYSWFVNCIMLCTCYINNYTKYTIIIICTLDEWGELARHQRSLTHHSRFSRLGIQCSIFPQFFLFFLSHCGCSLSKPLWLFIVQAIVAAHVLSHCG